MRHGEIQRARLRRVRERRRDYVRRRVACLLERAQRELCRRAIRQRVGEPEPGRASRCRADARADRIQVRLHSLIAEPGDQRAVWRRDRDLRQRPEASSCRLDIRIGRRHDRSAVSGIHPVNAVVGPAVACGDHHSGSGTAKPNSKGEKRGWLPTRHHGHANACPGENPSRLRSELEATLRSVAADHDTGLGGAGFAAEQPAGYRRGRGGHLVGVGREPGKRLIAQLGPHAGLRYWLRRLPLGEEVSSRQAAQSAGREQGGDGGNEHAGVATGESAAAG